MRAAKDPQALAAAVRAGDRRALARAITLVESDKAEHAAAAEALLAALLPHSGRAFRIGISGAPGVGKSTFIEAFGLHLIANGHRVAVLAIDPSSPRSGGSILGDKTRMEELGKSASAFIRPSPTGGTLGGVARRTREAGLICEAAGFDIVLIETVGVGQSETAVAGMVDAFLLLIAPAGGDELQGLKKGIVELADMVVVNKEDGELAAAAGRAAAEYRAALHLLRPNTPGWEPPVLTASSLERRGLDKIWAEFTRYRDCLGPKGLAAKRSDQAKAWMWSEIEAALRTNLLADAAVSRQVHALETKVSQGLITPAAAARQVLASLGKAGPASS